MAVAEGNPQPCPVPTRRGRLYYKPNRHPDREHEPQFSHTFHRRRNRPSRISVELINDDSEASEARVRSRLSEKLAHSGDSNSFGRRLSQLLPSSPAPSDWPELRPLPTTLPAKKHLSFRRSKKSEGAAMPSLDFVRHGNSRPVHSQLQQAAKQDDVSLRTTRTRSSSNPLRSNSVASANTGIPEEKPVAAGNGVSVSIHLTEPQLFLQGYDFTNSSTRSTAMLRGTMHLKVAKGAKIKAVSLRFRGLAQTRWPEGIPPKKVDIEETDTLLNHTWPFFNAQFPTAEGGTGADVVQLASSNDKHGTPHSLGPPSSSSLNVPSQNGKRMSLQVSPSKSMEKLDKLDKSSTSVASKGYRTFHPGDYVYNFELPIDSRLPETIDVDLGTVKYELEATIERAGAFRTNLVGTKEVTLIRTPAEGSLEQVEPIAISRNWEDQMHYDIVISGKSFPLGAKVPIAFKLTPLAKVQCHRVKVFITENIEYFCSNKRVHRMEPVRKILLFEKRSDAPSVSKYPGSSMRVTSGGGIPYDQRQAAAEGHEVMPQSTTNLLGHLEGDSNIGPTEMEINVQLPGCQELGEEQDGMHKLHFDTTYGNIQVHHWIKIVMRLSRPDSVDPAKRRHFEISIDSPFHILSCRASQANTALPAYCSPESADGNTQVAECGCPGAPLRRISPNRVPTLNSLNESRQSSNSGASDASQGSSAAAGAQERTGAPAYRGVPSNVASALAASAFASARSPGVAGNAQAPLTRPQPAHIHTNSPALQRPMHMLRTPSFNPPAFEDEQPPPPLATPPPQYADIASPTRGLSDYFSRLADAYDDVDTDEEDESRGHRRGRVRVPLTPGSRVNRSMEIVRGSGWPWGDGEPILDGNNPRGDETHLQPPHEALGAGEPSALDATARSTTPRNSVISTAPAPLHEPTAAESPAQRQSTIRLVDPESPGEEIPSMTEGRTRERAGTGTSSQMSSSPRDIVEHMVRAQVERRDSEREGAGAGGGVVSSW